MNKSLPLLDYTSLLFKNVSFKNCLIIASQHILEAQRLMFLNFIEKGCRPEDIFLIGKCYSTSKNTLAKMKKIGINVSSLSEKYDSKESFDSQFNKYISDFLGEISNNLDLNKFSKIIILEDGGNIMSNLIKLKGINTEVIGIEQTSAGYEKIKDLKLNFPVINVARSKAKLEIEAPLIVNCFEKLLKKSIKEENLNYKSALVIGSGAIGNIIYNRLKSNMIDTKRYDYLKERSDIERREFLDQLKDFDLIVGCTGKTSISSKHHSKLKNGTILVSCSSSDREFDAVKLRSKLPKQKDCHKNLNIEGLRLLNSGFPITFDGSSEPAPKEDMQITMSLLFSAACLGISNNYQNKIIDLDEKVQEKIVSKFKEIRSNLS